MAYRTFLFDADNTLFDFDASQALAFGSAMHDQGLPTDEEHRELYHTINLQCWKEYEQGLISSTTLRATRFARYFEAIGVAHVDPAAMGRAYLQYVVEHVVLLEGAVALLQTLQEAQCQIGLVTNGLQEVQRPRLDKAGLTPYFDVIVVSDEIKLSKPDKAFFDYTLAQFERIDPKSTVVVGDNLDTDIQGAINAGLYSCWFNKNQAPHPVHLRPHHTVHRLEEIPSLIG